MLASILISALVLGPVGVSSTAVCNGSKGFLAPDNNSFLRNGGVNQFPLTFNLTDSQQKTEVVTDGSFWANSFIHGSNGHNYYLASHVQTYGAYIKGAVPVYRASLLDVTDPSYYINFLKSAPANTSFWTKDGKFSATFPGFGMESSSKDPLHGIRTYCSIEGIEFDLTFNFTSSVLLNAGLGSYWVNGGLGYEWSLVRGATEGSLTISGEKIDIITEKSFSWFDRQWGSLQESFDWISVNFEESSWFDVSTMAVWSWTDPINGPKEFATVRSASTALDSVVPLTVTASKTKIWVSPVTGISWPREWVVKWDDIEMLVTTPRPDQVIEPPAELAFPWQFSGYIDVVAKKAGYKPVRGYGAVDRMTIP